MSVAEWTDTYGIEGLFEVSEWELTTQVGQLHKLYQHLKSISTAYPHTHIYI